MFFSNSKNFTNFGLENFVFKTYIRLVNTQEKTVVNYKVRIESKPSFKQGKFGPYFTCKANTMVKGKVVDLILIGFYSENKSTQCQTIPNRLIFHIFKELKKGDHITVFGKPIRIKKHDEAGNEVEFTFFRVLSAYGHIEKNIAKDLKPEDCYPKLESI